MNFCWFLGWKEGGGEDSKGWQCERAGSSGTNQSTIPGGMEVFFFEGVGGGEEITRNLKETEGTSVVVANRV